MKKYMLIYLYLLCLPHIASLSLKAQEKTCFQTSSTWIPEIDIRSDVAIVYGAGDRPGMTFLQRLNSWREKGYETHFMTGIAWGNYEDYFYGRWDGKMHLDEVQVAINHDSIWHGYKNPYIVPSMNYINYIKQAVVKKVIDAGITSIYLEEPEFWARSGYSDAFKREWLLYYGFPWRSQDVSAENTYLSNKLKYYLYYRAIKEVSDFAKSYGKQKGLNVKVYIATHSLVNYSSWKIVSPEASLASLPNIDGYIAQVWTGTSREPTYFNGVKKERVFENAFLEYGSMVSMTAPTGRKMIFLSDPIEDRVRDWEDYKHNYQATFTAEVLYPTVYNYEVMPWPERIFTKPYRLPNSDKKVLIPEDYSTQILVMINALNNLSFSNNEVSGSHGIAVLMGNSLMFQRFPTHNGYDDPQFSNFYGQTLPLLKRGIPITIVHMENLGYPDALKNIKVLIMSYSNMKPMSPEVHEHLVNWLKKGGVLVYCGKDDDPFQQVMEWWNTKRNNFITPSAHLFQLLGIKVKSDDKDVQRFKSGKGIVYVLRQDPKDFVMHPLGDSAYVNIVRNAYTKDARAGQLILKNNFYLKRGPFDIVAVMDESVSGAAFHVQGPVIDLFDPELPILMEKEIKPGHQAFLYNLGRVIDKNKPQVVASAARVYNEQRDNTSYSFVCKGPLKTKNSMRILLPVPPKECEVNDQEGGQVKIIDKSWDKTSHTLFLRFENSPNGVRVKIMW